MKRRLSLLALMAGLFLNGLAAAGVPPAVQAVDPWIREAPPGMPMLGGFVTLKNDSDRPVALVGAESPAFGSIELHRSIVKDGMARMVPQERIVVPPRGEVRLEPGSYHLMLMQPARPLAAGDKVQIQLRFDDGSMLGIDFPVRRDADGAAMSRHHHH
ncbi:MAG: copper chaperone PCu(A)C [Gammaproteobacteria bacterium]|nr:MAG: copper chaperone PCu(A)C [Gammaproteobacteria bacterium]